MSREKKLAKVYIVSEEANLDKKFEGYLVPDQHFYLFDSVCFFDPETTHYKGRRATHELLIRDLGLPEIPREFVNYVEVELCRSDENMGKTYFSKNRKGYQLSDSQIDYLCKMYEVDFKDLRR